MPTLIFRSVCRNSQCGGPQLAGVKGKVCLVSSMDQSRVISPHLESIAGGGGGVVAERALD